MIIVLSRPFIEIAEQCNGVYSQLSLRNPVVNIESVLNWVRPFKKLVAWRSRTHLDGPVKLKPPNCIVQIGLSVASSRRFWTVRIHLINLIFELRNFTQHRGLTVAICCAEVRHSRCLDVMRTAARIVQLNGALGTNVPQHHLRSSMHVTKTSEAHRDHRVLVPIICGGMTFFCSMFLRTADVQPVDPGTPNSGSQSGTVVHANRSGRLGTCS